MREVVDDWPDCKLALHVKRRLELTRREQESVHAPQIPPQDVDKQARAAFAASESWISLEFPGHRIAVHNLDRARRIDGFRRIGAPMHRLAVVAMTEELHDRFGSDFDLGHAAAALDLHHSLCSVSFL